MPNLTPKSILLPALNKTAVFHPRQAMFDGHPKRRFMMYNGMTQRAFPPVSALPIDWTKNNTLSYPMDKNDVLGDCFVAAMEHHDNTFTGNVGVESVYDDAATQAWYLQLSGGDNGLDNGTAISGWKKGLPGTPAATILDALDIDPLNAPMMQSAAQYFLGVQFQLAVPDAWINSFTTGAVWDAPATANMSNGHAIMFPGVDAQGRYKLLSWGTHGWITPAGVAVCEATAFCVFSLRMFSKTGYAPNGLHISQLAPLWVQAGGSSVVLSAVSQFPPISPNPPAPTPTPVPVPTPPPVPAPTSLFHLTVSRPVKKGGVVSFRAPVAIPAGSYAVTPSTASSGGLTATVGDKK